jgi:hypothetical protein
MKTLPSLPKYLATSFAAIGLFTCMTANATVLTEVEPNDTPATAQVIVHDGSITLTGVRESSSTNSFNDFFRFGATAGDTITFRVDSIGAGDPLIRLLDQVGTLILQDDDGGGGLNSLITYTVLTTGDYFAAVRGFSNSVYNYQLTVTGLTATDTSSVPIPGSIALLGLGLVGLARTRKTN